MRFFFLLIVLFITTYSFAQCEDCNSFTEALKKPEMAKALIINGGVSGKPLDSIPAAIGKLTNLEILYLTDHNIKKIIPEIAELKKLQELSFGGCKLTEVPDFVFTLKNLKELILYDNPFSDDYKEKLKAKAKAELPKTTLMMD